MPLGSVTYLCGSPGCGKSREIRQRALQAARAHGSDSFILLLPDAATVDAVQEALLPELGGLYDARILTFPALAHALLKGNHDAVARLEECQRFLLTHHVAVTPAVGLPAELTQHAGFIAGLSDFVDELKRAAVQPDQFSRAVRRSFPRDDRALGLARFYEAYQRHLTNHGLYDDPGLFWRATALLREGQDKPFTLARQILVDGFTDFTTTQLQVLHHLAQGPRDVVVTLTLDRDQARQEELAAGWRLLERLQEHLGEGEVVWLERCEDRPPALRHVVDHLFRLEAPPAAAAAGVQLLAAPGVLAEAREVLRDVKALLLNGVPPGEICLIFRSLDDYRQPLQEVARETGVPLAVAGSEPLSARPSVQVVLDLLQIPLGDYAQRDVVKLLKSNFVDPAALQGSEGPFSPEEFEVVACQARIIGGRRQWTDQLRLYRQRLQEEARLARGGQGLEEDVECRPLPAIAADRARLEQAASVFNRLAGKLDELSRPRTRGDHVQRLLQLLEDLGVPDRLTPGGTGADPACAHETSANVAGFAALLEALEQMAAADRILGDPQPLPFTDFCQEIVALCAQTRLDPPPVREGQVRALDAYGARQLRAAHVFLGGLVEGQWPAARQEQAFFDDRERYRLNTTGLQLDLSVDRQQDESYLFFLACAVATDRLTLSYPTMDTKGEALLRSHYVDEVERLFPEGLPLRERRLSDSIPGPEQIVCVRELLEHVVQHEQGRLPALPGGVLSEPEERLVTHTLAMARVETQRYGFEPFEQHDGILADPAIQARLAARFGPEHWWSASALGCYGTCPFRFFVQRVLWLAALEMPQEEVEVVDLGSLAHTILRRFFADHQAAHSDKPLAARELPPLLAQVRDLTDRAFDEWIRQGLVTHRKLWELARERMREDLAALVEYEHGEMDAAGLVPRAFEAPYEIEIAAAGESELLHLRGTIDRVDVQAHPPPGEPQEYAVYDYKGGEGVSPQAIEDGADFQMPFYALGAAQVVLGGQEPPPRCRGWAYYRYRQPAKLVRPVGKDRRYKNPQEYIDLALQWATAHVRHIREGRFPVDPQDCAYCDFGQICRFAPWRTMAKAGGEGDEA